MPSLATSINGLRIDPRHYRAGRDLCRRAAPDLFFAASMLTRPQRLAVFSLHAVTRQLLDIIHAQACDGAPDHGCGQCSGSAPGPSGCGDGRHMNPSSSMPPMCGGESIAQRRAVCRSVLDYLYAGERTGKPELDGFHLVAQHLSLDQSVMTSLVDALAEEAEVKRYATWSRLRNQLDRGAGALTLAVFPSLSHEPDRPLEATAQHQALAWAAALRMVTILHDASGHWRRGRLLLPLEDLVQHGLSEQDIGRFVQCGNTEGDERWRAFFDAMRQRTLKLYRGGCVSLARLSPSARRFTAVLGELHMLRLTHLAQRGGDPFRGPVRLGHWRRVVKLGSALRLVSSLETRDA